MKPESSRPTGHSGSSPQTPPAKPPSRPAAKHSSHTVHSLDSVHPMLSPQGRQTKRQNRHLANWKITTQKPGKFLTLVARGVLKLAKPLITGITNTAFAGGEEKLQSSAQLDREKLTSTQRILETRNKRMTTAKKRLDESGAQLKAGNKEAGKQYEKSLTQYAKELGHMFTDRESARDAGFRHAESQEKLARYQKSTPKQKALFTKNLEALASLCIGLRASYSALQSPGKKVPSEISLPSILIPNDFDSDDILSDAKIIVKQISCDDNGNLILSVPQCRVTVANTTDTTKTSKFTISLGLKIVVKKPLGAAVEKLLACKVTSLPGEARKLGELVHKLTRHSKLDSSFFLTLFGISLDQSSVSTSSSGENPLITQAAVNSILQAFFPQLQRIRRYVEKQQLGTLEKACARATKTKHLLEETAGRYQQLIAEANSVVNTLDEKNALTLRLTGKLTDMKNRMARVFVQLEGAEDNLKEKERRRLIQANRVLATENQKQSTFHNVAQVFFGVQKVMDAQPGSSPLTLDFPEQHLQLASETDAVLTGTKAQVRVFSLDDTGTLKMEISELTTSMEVKHKGEKTHMPDIQLKDTVLSITPPLGKVVYEFANFEFPVSMKEIIDLVKTYQTATSKHKGADGFPSPKRFSDYCQLTLGHSACQVEGEWTSGEWTSGKVSANREQLPFEKPLKTLLQKTIGMDDASYDKLTSTLAMAALGLSQQDDSEGEESADEFFDAYE